LIGRFVGGVVVKERLSGGTRIVDIEVKRMGAGSSLGGIVV